MEGQAQWPHAHINEAKLTKLDSLLIGYEKWDRGSIEGCKTYMKGNRFDLYQEWDADSSWAGKGHGKDRCMQVISTSLCRMGILGSYWETDLEIQNNHR